MVKRLLLRLLLMTSIIIGFITILITTSHLVYANMYATSSAVTKTSSGQELIVWAIVIIGGSIGITLSYVSWRKYKGERNSKKKAKDKLID